MLDVKRQRVLRQWKLPIQNIGGLAVAEGQALITHQQLDRGWADRDGVHWGILLAHRLRGFPLASLSPVEQNDVAERALAPMTLMKQSWADSLGLVGAASSDPGAIFVAPGLTAVALEGIDEVLIAAPSYRKQVEVGDRPMALTSVGAELWVANQLDDTLSVIELASGEVRQTVSLGSRGKLSAVERGERMFFDGHRSHDGWMSCHSCHTEGHTTGGYADTLGDGGYGDPKRIPSLLGVGETGPWAWNGKMDSLEQQVKKSVVTTMHGEPLSDGETADLTAYLRSLRMPNAPTAAQVGLTRSKDAGHRAALDRRTRRGKAVFRQQACHDCHRAPTYTSRGAYDVDVEDAVGNREFNPPSLRGVRWRDALFHDGRHELDAMIRNAEHQLAAPLSKGDADALIAFLRSL